MPRYSSACSVKGWSHRQERAKIIRESQTASDEIRAARSAALARMDLERRQQEALERVAKARERFEMFDPEGHKLALADALREAEELAAALQPAVTDPPPPKKTK
ncbi:hypothetical protein [Bradyrhizobium sp.]|uniref:hypothetical protein n=1 Tax=Bradyrhizobium sp. TaxID=376 RepID=UPI0007C9144D|nr:hypothetical protein [Bradyrhizobium sp.]